MRQLVAYSAVSLFALAQLLAASGETPNEYAARAGRFYETKYLPETLDQIAKRVELSPQERELVATALKEHIRRYLETTSKKSCLTHAEWRDMLGAFDGSLIENLPAEKAAAVIAWREHPAPEGNALSFLFYPPWSPFTKFEAIVVDRAPQDAIDCGFQGRNSGCFINPCVLDAVKARKPFRAVYGGTSIDSLVARGIVGRADGTGTILQWDSMGNRLSEEPCRFHIGRSIHGAEHVDCK